MSKIIFLKIYYFNIFSNKKYFKKQPLPQFKKKTNLDIINPYIHAYISKNTSTVNKETTITRHYYLLYSTVSELRIYSILRTAISCTHTNHVHKIAFTCCHLYKHQASSTTGWAPREREGKLCNDLKFLSERHRSMSFCTSSDIQLLYIACQSQSLSQLPL